VNGTTIDAEHAERAEQVFSAVSVVFAFNVVIGIAV